MKKIILTAALLLCTTSAYAEQMVSTKAFNGVMRVEVYVHDYMNTRYLLDGCMVKTLRTDVYTGERGHFTIVDKKKSKFAISQAGRKFAYIQSTAGKAIIVGSCIRDDTTLDEAIDIYRDILQVASDEVGDV